MPLKFHWFLPTNGDSRYVVGGGHGVTTGRAGGDRPANLPYLGQIARSAEQLGFDAALTPTGAWCEDAWLTTAMLSSVSERLRYLVAFRPGLTSPTLAAQMAGTFQNLSGGRLLLNVVVGGESHEQRAYGDFLDKEGRYARCAEFLHIVRSLWAGETVDFHGEHLQVEGATLAQIPAPVSLEPALVSFSLANSSSTWPALRRAAHLGLSVLADHHHAVCRQLAGTAARRFDRLDLRTTEAGAILLDDAVATFDCTLHQEVAAGDHTIACCRRTTPSACGPRCCSSRSECSRASA